MTINYHDKVFKPVSTSENGEVDTETIFHYQQKDDIVSCTYSGHKIKFGQLIAVVDEKGTLDMRYHQINNYGELMTGICRSTPEILANGKIRLHEQWKWTSGDFSEGTSILEEI